MKFIKNKPLNRKKILEFFFSSDPKSLLLFIAFLSIVIFLSIFLGSFIYSSLGTTYFQIENFLVVYVIIILIIASIIYAFKAASKISYKELYNPFLIFSIALSVLIISIGFSAISAIYRSPFPLSVYVDSRDSNPYYSFLTCYSLDSLRDKCNEVVGCEYPVAGNWLSCSFESNVTNVSSVNVVYSIKNYLYDLEWENKTSGTLKFADNKTVVFDIRVPIKKEGSTEFYIRLIFNSNITNQISTGFIRYTAINEEFYQRRINEKYALFIALLSIALISSFSVSKNLMDIWERRNRRS